MDINELESYRLTDAIKFNDSLNPRIWGKDEKMLPEVRDRLLAIADDFREFLGIDVEVKDITVSGSNAAYTYTPHSDIDLHLVVDMPENRQSEIYRELFDAKKYAYNDQHDFKIGGYDVELYVQDANQTHHSQGIYSVLNDQWVSVPRRRRPNIDDISVRSKYEDLGQRIDDAIESGDLERLQAMGEKIRNLRQSGLDTHGEFGPENLAFKVLRANGTLDRLRQARLAAKDQLMSLDERRRKKKSKKKKWGSFGGMWFPGYAYYGSGTESDSGGDGGGESTKEDYDPNAKPPGPETKPEMPAGTVLVNVSDVYDWYKLGKDISDLKRANPSAYGKGVPQTVLSFGSEPLEHEYKQDLDRLGLTTVDIDRNAKQKDPRGTYRMDEDQDLENRLQMFVDFACKELGIEDCPDIKIKRDPAWSERNSTFGKYIPDDNVLIVSVARRHPVDVMRTMAHELTHHRQNEITDIPDGAGETGTSFEDSANAMAGRIMRDFVEQYPRMFGEDSLDEGWREKAGALATAACIAGTPGCATTQGPTVGDVLRGVQTVGRAANTIKQTGTAGARELVIQRAKDELQRRQGHVVPESSKEKLHTPINKAQRGHDDYYRFITARQSAGRPLTKREQEFLKTYGMVKHLRQQVAEASGYIPTEAERDDPRYSMALTVDVHPGQTGKEANKLGLETDAQGRPALLMKKLNNLLESVKNEDCWDGYRQQGMKRKGDRMVPNCVKIDEDEEDLFEVKMSPGELEKWARSPEAEGIQAGFEAEMIFRDTQRDDDEQDMEPDYDMDTRPDSIEEIIEFFSNDDWGYGLSPRSERNLRENLFEEFVTWRDEQISDDWDNNSSDYVRDYMETNVWGDDSERQERINSKLDENGIDPNEATEEQLKSAETSAREDFEQEIDDEIENQGNFYDQARDEYFEMKQEDDEYGEYDWLRQEYRYMSDIADSFSLDWPYWAGGSQGGGGREWSDIAQSLESTVGMDVRVGSGYHSVSRAPGRWIIEPDGSLDPDDSEDSGLEIVSPPMPLPETLEKLQQVIEWGNNEADAYTNDSTGLHMGISIPYKGGDVDYVKLVLFMGDQYVLDKFGRASNTYTASAIQKLRQNIAGARNHGQLKEATLDPMSALELIKKNLIELAARYVQDGVGTSKYTSAHIKPGYIEFRSPGGDYLSMESRGEFSDIRNTMLRFARAMQIAGRPDLERREYAKKLYKLIDPGTGNPSLKLFADYAAGTIDRDELKKRWAETALQKDAPEVLKKSTWQLYDKTTGKPVLGQQYGNYAYDDALTRAWKGISPGSSIEDFKKRYELIDTNAETGEWDVVDRDTQEVIGVIGAETRNQAVSDARDGYGNRNFYIRPHVEFDRAGKSLSRRAQLAQRIKTSKQQAQQQDNEQDRQEIRARLGEPQPVWRNQDDGQQSEYHIYDRSTNDIVIGFRALDDERALAWFDDYRREHPGSDVGVRVASRNNTPRPASTQSTQTSMGEFTGRWQIRNVNTGEVLYTFGGIGNSQSDANRVAQQWIQQTRFDDPVEVVPEMA